MQRKPAVRGGPPVPPIARHYGMDWLRTGAFALLILYHIGMVYSPWNFHVKSVHQADWVALPMLALNAWRLTLLFVVSGFATRALLSRSDSLAGFAGNRSLRLLVPLAFGVAVIVPPQAWVELTTKHGYRNDFLSFWFTDYFRFGTLDGMVLPTWNHLWFVAYLWVYTLALALILAMARGGWAQRGYDRLLGGWRVVALPLGWSLAVHVLWFPMAAETHALFDDPVAHAIYLPAFLFGFGLAGSPRVLASIRRVWKWAAVAAVIAYLVKLGAEIRWPGPVQTAQAFLPFYLFAHAVQQWSAVLALIGVADRFLNRDHRLRPMLTEAIFPFYLIHQTIIVVAIWALRPLAPSGPVEFLLTSAATIAGCWAFYWIGRQIGWLRPLIGLKRRPVVRPVESAIALQS